MTDFSEIENIFWDFDGVLIDSMAVRDMGFTIVLRNYPTGQVNQLLEYHHQNGGLSRYVKFRYFFEKIRKEIVTEERISQFASEFSSIMRQLLVQPDLLIQDSVSFVMKYSKRFKMHIISGSDENELRYLCTELGLSPFFRSIHGSPAAKKELIADVLKHNFYQFNSTLMIGDSINDFHAAQFNGIKFAGYNNSRLKQIGVIYIDSFSNLRF